jgi:outer membrane receptor for ferrienterochelin and colicin
MRTARAFVCFLAVLALSLPALGQGNPTGKLSGRVTSEDGSPMPGVTVTVSSPSLQGERTAVTSDGGDYLFPSLPAGDYTVTFAVEGMVDVTQQLRLSGTQARQLDAAMSGAAQLTEAIVVTATGESLQNVSQTPQAAATFGKTLVDLLPAGRTVNQIVALSPGVQPNGPSKNSDTGLSNITVSGAPTYENLFLVNGVVMNENIRGQAFDLFIEDAIEETTTATGGVSAEFGRFSGGVINVLTKSGGNDFSGSARVTANNQSWEEKRLNPTTGQDAPQLDKTVPTYELTLGGPVLRDRLWFFLAGRDREFEESRNTTTTGIAFPFVQDQQRYEAKLTATLTPRHSLLANYSEIDTAETNVFGAVYDLDSVGERQTPQELWSLNYTGAFGTKFLLTGQYSERQFSFVGSGSKSTDLIDGTWVSDRSRGPRYNSPVFCGVCKPEERDNTNALVKGAYFLSTERLGSHDLVAGYDTFEDIRLSDNHQSGSDFVVLGTSATISGQDVTPIFRSGSTLIQFWPIINESQGTSFKTNSFFVNDSWRVSDRLSVNLGLRYDVNDGANAFGQKVADDTALSPRLAVSYDTRGTGDLVLYGSYGQYVAALANSIGDSTSPAGVPWAFQWAYLGPEITGVSTDVALQRLFDWFATNNGGLPSVANPVGGGLLPLQAAALRGVNQQMAGTLDSPNVTEYTVGASARLGARGIVRADVVFREWGNFYHQRTDTSTGQVTGTLGAITQRFDLTLVENNDDLYEREYMGLHTQFRYRASDRLDLGGNYTLSKTEGNFNGENQGSGPVAGGFGNYPEYFDVAWNAPNGPLSLDQRHRLNLYGVFRILRGDRHDLSVALLQTYASGHPYEANANITLANFVANPGYLTPPVRVGYFFSDRGEFTTPDITSTDVSFNYDVDLGRFNVFVKPEVINVFNNDDIDTTDIRYFNTSVLTADTAAACPGSPTGRCLAFNPFTETPVEGVHWVKGPQFGQATNPLGFQQPRTYRLAVGLRF